MAVLRTPETRFANLPGYPFAPHYVDLAKAIGRSGEARMHYVDEGSGQVILCLHGEPSWSFLYRRMIPILAKRGRVLAPDLFGFGKSDKFTERADYTYAMHHDALRRFMDALSLRDITLVCQTGAVSSACSSRDRPALRASYHEHRAADRRGGGGARLPRVAGVRRQHSRPTDRSPLRPRDLSRGPARARDPRRLRRPLPGPILQGGRAGFPEPRPDHPRRPRAADNRAAWKNLERWNKPCLVMAGDKDPVLGIPAAKIFERRIPTAGTMVVIENAGHFLQEDKGEEIAERIAAWLDG
jgi:haloalkane dehalogenase